MTLQEQIEAERKRTEQQRLEELRKSQEIANQQKEQINKQFDKQVTDAERSYDDLYRQNEVQKHINRMAVAEGNANLGLTDSGLNRMQRTAIELSHANNMGRINRQRQQQIDSLELGRGQGLSGINQQQMGDSVNINKYYDNLAAQRGTAAYNAEQDRLNQLKIEEAKSKNTTINNISKFGLGSNGQPRTSHIIAENGFVLSRDFMGNLADNGVKSFKTKQMNANGEEIEGFMFQDTNSKKQSFFPLGTNPFTGDNNNNIYAEEIREYGTFNNGYQPRGIKNHGAFVDFVGTDSMNGNRQKVWVAEDGTLWMWNGRTNQYEQRSR